MLYRGGSPHSGYFPCGWSTQPLFLMKLMTVNRLRGHLWRPRRWQFDREVFPLGRSESKSTAIIINSIENQAEFASLVAFAAGASLKQSKIRRARSFWVCNEHPGRGWKDDHSRRHYFSRNIYLIMAAPPIIINE